ncbi:MAG: hypothetical protein KAI17_08340 [Thiotrichaceae bacterium]|nr:hypothetical protein [Thiotrichaceae bacterium]
MNKILITVASILLTACASDGITPPAKVTAHTRVNKTLDNCVRLGEVKTKFEANSKLSRRENLIKAKKVTNQQAFDEYGADNIVYINTRYVEGGYRQKDIIHNRGVAYGCDKHTYKSKNGERIVNPYKN